MAKDAEKRKDKLYNVLALLLMLALFGCGVWGVVESRIAKRDYKNSPDVRQISAVVSSYRTIESKDDDGDVISTKYEAKLTFEVDGQSYTGRETYYREVSNGEIVTVEVYQTPKGSYKVAPEGNPVDFLLYCIAIVVGGFLTFAMTCAVFGKTPEDIFPEEQNNGRRRRR